MKVPITGIKGLPSEIFNCIFFHLQYMGIRNLCECALVCKAWLPSVQNRLYSAVYIQRLIQLEQFHRTVEHNLTIGSMVKNLTLSTFCTDNAWKSSKCDSVGSDKFKKDVLYNLKSSLLLDCLPNLVILKGPDICALLLQALQDSKLESLKRFNTFTRGEEESVDYTSCALLMKNRLENLEETFFRDWLSYGNLYGRLGEFSQLKELKLGQKSGEKILLLEEIVATCPSLEEIQIHFTEESNSSSLSIDKIRNFVPTANIKTLWLAFTNDVDEKFIAYLTHKFPRLDRLSLCGLAVRLNHQVLEQFLQNLSRMKMFDSPCFSMDHILIRSTISKFWAATSPPGKKRVEFSFFDHDSIESLELKHDGASICYSLSNAEQKHMEFLKENGKFLQAVDYDFELEDHRERHLSAGAYLAHIVAYCPNIQDINLTNCILNPGDGLPSKKCSLRDLHIYNREIQEGALEWLSSFLSRVDFLLVSDEDSLGNSTNTYVIRMPYTKVNTILVGAYRGGHSKVKLLNTSDGNSSYYTVCVEKGREVIPSTEEEYLRDRADFIEISCASNPIIKSYELKYV